jgi:hypothetical protein
MNRLLRICGGHEAEIILEARAAANLFLKVPGLPGATSGFCLLLGRKAAKVLPTLEAAGSGGLDIVLCLSAPT